MKGRDELAFVPESGCGLAHRHAGRQHRLNSGGELRVGVDLRRDSGTLMRIGIGMIIGAAVRFRIRVDVRMRSGTYRGTSTLGTCAGSNLRATAQADAGTEAAVLCKTWNCHDDDRERQ